MTEQLKEIIFENLATTHIDPKFIETTAHFILLLIAAAVSWFIGYLCRKIISPLILKLVKNTKFIWDDYFFNLPVIKAFCHIIPGMVFYMLLPICLPEERDLLGIIIIQGTKVYIAATFISLITAFLNNIETFTVSDEKFKDKQLYGTIEFLKILVYFIGGIIIIAFLIGKSPISMIAGIGAAATVLLLVFKDSILGLVAGIQLSTNKMLKPGDWITIKKLNVDGVVEQVSLTTIKVRNFDNTISTVPPYFLISDTFQNWSPMKESSGRRVKRAIYIDMNSIHFAEKELIEKLYRKKLITKRNNENSDKRVNLSLFREYAENYIQRQSYVNKEATILIRQLDPTPNGLPLEFYYYSSNTDFKAYEQFAAETIEHCIATLSEFELRVYQSPSGYDIQCRNN